MWCKSWWWDISSKRTIQNADLKCLKRSGRLFCEFQAPTVSCSLNPKSYRNTRFPQLKGPLSKAVLFSGSFLLAPHLRAKPCQSHGCWLLSLEFGLSGFKGRIDMMITPITSNYIIFIYIYIIVLKKTEFGDEWQNRPISPTMSSSKTVRWWLPIS